VHGLTSILGGRLSLASDSLVELNLLAKSIRELPVAGGIVGTCFVIQPFDGGPFDKRYSEVIEPAIKAAALEPYRVDRDPGVEVPIDEIENGIRRADICVAEISTDNPNVWYELGYAFASRKQVVLVASADQRQRFPFDVQHRSVLRYTAESPSDFQKLGVELTERLKAAVERRISLAEVVDEALVAPSAGLKQHEVAALAAIGTVTLEPFQAVSLYELRQALGGVGFTEIAATLAVRALTRMELVDAFDTEDERGDRYRGLRATEAGMEWLEANQGSLALQRSPRNELDELPF
jgi:hypothetical protein